MYSPVRLTELPILGAARDRRGQTAVQVRVAEWQTR